VTNDACRKLKIFTSSAAVSVNTSLINAPTVSSSTPDVFTLSVSPSSKFHVPTLNIISHSPSPTTSHSHHDTNDDKKLLYIVIPTAAPAAFIISFITAFCIFYWCYRRKKKRLYIKLTSTIYEDENSDDSDE